MHAFCVGSVDVEPRTNAGENLEWKIRQYETRAIAARCWLVDRLDSPFDASRLQGFEMFTRGQQHLPVRRLLLLGLQVRRRGDVHVAPLELVTRGRPPGSSRLQPIGGLAKRGVTRHQRKQYYWQHRAKSSNVAEQSSKSSIHAFGLGKKQRPSKAESKFSPFQVGRLQACGLLLLGRLAVTAGRPCGLSAIRTRNLSLAGNIAQSVRIGNIGVLWAHMESCPGSILTKSGTSRIYWIPALLRLRLMTRACFRHSSMIFSANISNPRSSMYSTT